MTGPTVTVAIPFYRGLDHLAHALASVRAQTRDDWTCVVVDDCGPEPGAAEVVTRIGDPRIRSVRNDRNLGLAGNWNRCLALAEARLVTLLHADDALHPGYVDAVVRAHARHPGAVAVYSRARVIGPDGAPVFSLPDRVKRVIEPRATGDTVVAGEAGLDRLLRGQFIFCPTLCYRVDALPAEPFAARWQQVTDLAFLADTLFAGGVVVGIAEVHYDYRRHPGSETARLTASTRRFEEELAVYDEIAARAAACGWERAAARARRKRIIRAHLAYRVAGDLVHGRRDAARAKWALLRTNARV